MAVEISGRRIGAGEPCFIIAEAGVNHNGDLALAKRLIDAATEAKADAVKFQTFLADRLVSAVAPKARYQEQTTGAAESQFDMLRRLELPAEAFRELQAHCRAREILFLSTPFDEESVDLLDALGVPAFKVGSGDVTNGPLLESIARTGRPVILSTGMSDLQEVTEAVRRLQASGTRQLVLLHCVSSYPADPSEANLRALRTMAEAFNVPVGYSDHTLGLETALAAVALGASVVEKHVTLDRTLPGPDHRASVEPRELAELVKGIRTVERAFGDGRKRPMPSEIDTARVARRSLIAAKEIPAGTVLTESLIAIQRPGGGLAPSSRSQLVGKVAKVDIPGGTLLRWDMVEEEVGCRNS